MLINFFSDNLQIKYKAQLNLLIFYIDNIEGKLDTSVSSVINIFRVYYYL